MTGAPRADPLRVGFFPGDSKANRWGRDIHPWSAMATRALEEQGCEVTFVSKDDLVTLPRRPSFDVLHLNWPQSLSNPESYKRRKYMPASLYRRWFTRQLDRETEALHALQIPVVWQVHDLPAASDPRMLELLTLVFDRFFRRADGLTFYEQSAQPAVFELLGDPVGKELGVAHLGGYVEIHGAAVSRSEARERLGISGARKVFLYAGTVRWSRSPVEFLKRFAESSTSDDLLIVTGRGTQKLEDDFSHDRVLFRSGMVEHDEFRDMVCASDYVINDAYRYLGSAIIRVALGYGVPVIARSFGCTSDIARGAYIEVEESEGGLERALNTALELPDATYQEMVREALLQDAERSWSAYGKGAVDVYRRVLAKAQR